MAPQSEIGNFVDDNKSSRIVLSPDDQKVYGKWEFVNIKSYEEEIVEFLYFEERLGHISPDELSALCCTVS
jgi:hypothetical protein